MRWLDQQHQASVCQMLYVRLSRMLHQRQISKEVSLTLRKLNSIKKICECGSPTQQQWSNMITCNCCRKAFIKVLSQNPVNRSHADSIHVKLSTSATPPLSLVFKITLNLS